MSETKAAPLMFGGYAVEGNECEDNGETEEEGSELLSDSNSTEDGNAEESEQEIIQTENDDGEAESEKLNVVQEDIKAAETLSAVELAVPEAIPASETFASLNGAEEKRKIEAEKALQHETESVSQEEVKAKNASNLAAVWKIPEELAFYLEQSRNIAAVADEVSGKASKSPLAGSEEIEENGKSAVVGHATFTDTERRRVSAYCAGTTPTEAVITSLPADEDDFPQEDTPVSCSGLDAGSWY